MQDFVEYDPTDDRAEIKEMMQELADLFSANEQTIGTGAAVVATMMFADQIEKQYTAPIN